MTINGVEIEKVDNFNFLGFGLLVFMIFIHTLQTDILVLFYNSLILP